MDRSRAITILRDLGWTHTFDDSGEFHQAIHDFQRGFALSDHPLEVDGDLGRHTADALTLAHKRLETGKPTASAHFSFSEFACKCNGHYDKCRRIWIHRRLLRALEVLRRECYPAGLTVISGCRCYGHNQAVGGATNSMHLHGRACDVPNKVSWQRVADLRRFSGIGFDEDDGHVEHVDVRTSASVANPTRWVYS